MGEINLGEMGSKTIVRLDNEEIRGIFTEKLMVGFEGYFEKGEYSRDTILNSLSEVLEQAFTDKGEVLYGKVYHKNGIGNNCQYPINYITDGVIYEIGYININHNMYGRYMVYVEDMGEETITNVFKVGAR